MNLGWNNIGIDGYAVIGNGDWEHLQDLYTLN
jgi:hypothetical protein